jgi:hypothetical protein
MPSPNAVTARPGRRATRFVRHVTVAAISAGVLAAAFAYAVSPPVETISTLVSVRSVKVGAESISGRVLEGGKAAKGTLVTISRRETHRVVKLHVRHVDAHGRFVFPESVGLYLIVIKHGSKTSRVSITLRHGKAVFINVVIRRNGGIVIGPIIFNY